MIIHGNILKKIKEFGFGFNKEIADDGREKFYIFIVTADQFKLLSNLCNQDLVLTFATEKKKKHLS